MPSHKAFTIGMIRTLRRLGPVRKRGRMPRQQHPDLIASEYYKALLPSIHVSERAFGDIRGELLSLLQDERRMQGKQDSAPKDRAAALIEHARKESARLLDEANVFDIARRFALRTSNFQRDQLDKQVRSQLAVPLSMLEAPIVAKLEGFAARNVDLIVTVPERYFDRIRRDALAAFESGTNVDTLSEDMRRDYDISENDARRIARDQIGKLNGELNEERQTAMGVTGYIWRTANDARVRDEHAEREGQHFDWSDPPEDGHPGEAVQCRCFAEPDLEPIMEAIDVAS
jgi:SPP1 gp7 family putative phage head morphogenesis protein